MKAREEDYLLVDEKGKNFVMHDGYPMRGKRNVVFQHWFLRALLVGLDILALSLLVRVAPQTSALPVWSILEPWLESVLSNLGTGILLTVAIAFFVEKVGWVRQDT